MGAMGWGRGDARALPVAEAHLRLESGTGAGGRCP